MVIVEIYGGLGNQMFQYAAGLVLASRLKTKLYVDASWFNEKQPDNVTPRQYELDIFGINKSNLLLRKLASITIRKTVTLNEPGFTKYSEEFKRFICNEYLRGAGTKQQLEIKYGIGNSRLTYWLRDKGHTSRKLEVLSLPPMKKRVNNEQEEKSIEQLNAELKEAQLLAETYRKMIEIAERELKINIIKKSNTK